MPETPRWPFRIAHVRHGKCGICGQPVMAGEAYVEAVGRGQIFRGMLVHYDCYKPEDTPTAEELLWNKGYILNKEEIERRSWES